MAIIGIDLGTTNSLACVWREGRVELIPNELGEYKTSSAVSVLEDGTVLVEFSDEVLGVEVAAFGFFYELYCRIVTLCHRCSIILGNHP